MEVGAGLGVDTEDPTLGVVLTAGVILGVAELNKRVLLGVVRELNGVVLEGGVVREVDEEGVILEVVIGEGMGPILLAVGVVVGLAVPAVLKDVARSLPVGRGGGHAVEAGAMIMRGSVVELGVKMGEEVVAEL